MLACQENTREVHINCTIPNLLSQFMNAGILSYKFDARVCYHNIQTLPARHRLIHSTSDLTLLTDVSNQGQSFSTCGRDSGKNFIDGRSINIDETYSCALLGKSDSGCAP